MRGLQPYWSKLKLKKPAGAEKYRPQLEIDRVGIRASYFPGNRPPTGNREIE